MDTGLLEFQQLPDGELPALDPKTKKPLPERIRDAAAAHAIYRRLREDDLESAANRAAIRAMFDGEPPFSDDALAAANQADACNINFDEAGAILDKAQAGYVDLLNSVPTYITCRTNYGEPTQREEWSGAIAEEFTAMVKNWPEYSHRFLLLSSFWLQDGVAWATFDHEFDWRYTPVKFGDFLIPRKTLAAEENIEVACWVREYPPHKLYEHIQDPGSAKASGWNVGAVQKLLLEDAGESSDRKTSQSWEEWQESAKNNDLGASYQGASIKLVHAFVREFNGKISHYIIPEKEAGGEFLFKKRERFDNVHQAIVGFTYGQGTNGYYHGIRGLGWRIFPIIQELNISRGQFLDGAKLSASMLVQPRTMQDLEQLSITYYGPYAVLAPGFSAVPTGIPNFSQNVLPAIGELTRLVNDKVGQFSSQNVFSDSRERTRYEAEATMQQVSELSVTSLALFYEPMDRMFREMFRRAMRKNYPETVKGGAEVKKFRDRLEKRGVPLEALFEVDIDSVRVVRAVGGGSAASRQLALRELTDLSPSFDVIGRQRLMRDRIASRVGYDNVDRYLAPPEVERVDINEHLAALENNDLVAGQPVAIRPNDPHMLHLPVHVRKLEEFVQQVEQEGAALEAVAEPMARVHGHAVAHLEAVQGDAGIREDVAFYREALQQIGEIIVRAMLRMEKIRRDQAAEQQAAGAAPNPQADTELAHQAGLRRKLEENQIRLQALQEEARIKIALRIQESNAKIAIQDAEAAARIRRFGSPGPGF